ncbi:MAG: S1 family peptidase [Acidobacteriota bacterium]|nr:S1 family peptidase [Acidobacteriota bacterium]
MTIAPSATTVVVGQMKTFTATVTGTTNTAVSWSVNGGSGNGTISSVGVYTAPASVPSPATATITATSKADATKFATATVTIAATASAVQVTVQPATASVSDFLTQQFAAVVIGSANTAVTWKVNGTTGGTQKLGFISTNGLYVAPSGVPTKSDAQGNTVTTTVTISAVSQADTSSSGTATVTIVPDNANAQSAPVELGTTGSNAKDFVNNTAKHTITCCGGTLGSLVSRGGVQYILSNNHVLARSDAATVGDAIVQPGLIDTSTCTTAGTTTVANLTQFFNLQSGPAPKIDAAIAQVVSGKVDTSGKVIYLGATADANGVPVAGAPLAGSGTTVTVNRAVAKSGRSTGLSCSTVDATNISTSVDYTANCDGTGTTFTVTYVNQIGVLGGDFSGQGDSGSLMVTQDTAAPVALLYAGSDTDTVGNPVADVLNFFKSGSTSVTFVGGSAHQVVGCSLPNAPQSAKTVVASSISAELVQQAAATRDLHAPELMAHPEVQSVGVGASYDNPKEPAILFFVTQGMPRTDLPAQVDDVRTRIVEAPLFAKRGAVSAADSAMLEKAAATPQLVYTVSDTEMARAKVVHTAHVESLMKKAGVQGVGIGSSIDSPGEAALMIFTVRGVSHDPIPAVIDGLRTRVRESSRFRAGTVGIDVPRTCKLAPAKAGAKTAAVKTAAAMPVKP